MLFSLNTSTALVLTNFLIQRSFQCESFGAIKTRRAPRKLYPRPHNKKIDNWHPPLAAIMDQLPPSLPIAKTRHSHPITVFLLFPSGSTHVEDYLRCQTQKLLTEQVARHLIGIKAQESVGGVSGEEDSREEECFEEWVATELVYGMKQGDGDD